MKKLVHYLTKRRLTLLARRIWEQDMQYRFHRTQYERFLKEFEEYKSQNPIYKRHMGEYSSIKNRVIRIYPLLVAGTDVLLAFIVLSQITAHLSQLPPVLTAFLGSLAIAIIEISLGALLDRFDEDDRDKPESSSLASLSHKAVRACASLSAFAIIFIIPLISLSEYYAQLSVLDSQIQLGILSLDGWTESVIGLRLKYLGLSILSLISHAFVVFKCDKIFQAFAVHVFKRNLAAWKLKEENFMMLEANYQSKIITALLRYSDYRRHHVSKYGFYEGLHQPNFSDPVMRIFKRIQFSEEKDQKHC